MIFSNYVTTQFAKKSPIFYYPNCFYNRIYIHALQVLLKIYFFFGEKILTSGTFEAKLSK